MILAQKMEDTPISLLTAFDDLPDPRRRECPHRLDELLLAAICGVISGAESWTSVVQWSQTKLDWLRHYLPYAHGIASHDTFGRVSSLLDASRFEHCFMRWIGGLCPSLEGASMWPSMASACAARMTARVARFIWCRRGAARSL
ncbi:ISAs1 family transposase [Verminephrobacter eiseniae]|uniref:ISAs1 family transposase n=2 Tax=Verminephrobacter eiseniae TaxID=364317 RepID=UPI001E404A79|nr:ISAs1 family transposase [Verminephrobacter eiseniae]